MSTSTFQVISQSRMPPYHVSKWAYIAALLSAKELKELFHTLKIRQLCDISRVLPFDQLTISVETLLENYQSYLEGLIDSSSLQNHKIATYGFASSLEHFRAMQVGEDRFILKPVLPVLRVQKYQFNVSEEGKVLSMVQGQGAIRFGLQFSYPMIFQDPDTLHVLNVLRCENFSRTTSLYRILNQFIREHTNPLAILWQGRKRRLPVKLGKDCFSWVGKHHDLGGLIPDGF